MIPIDPGKGVPHTIWLVPSEYIGSGRDEGTRLHALPVLRFEAELRSAREGEGARPYTS